MKKKVFITGATGFIGSNITNRFVQDNLYDVHILTRKTSDFHRIKNILPRLNIHEADITNFKDMEKILQKIKPNYIFHLANIGVYGGFENETNTVIQVNLLGTINLIQAAHNLPYEVLVNTGSSSEYGSKKKRMTELDICEPQGIYAVSKLASTLYARDYAIKNKKNIVNLRVFTPYGPFDNEQRLIPYLISNFINNKKVSLYKKNTVRDFIYIDDVVKAFQKCIQKKNIPFGQIINIGSGKEISVEQIVKKLKKITTTKSEVSWNNDIRRYESKVWRADIKKAKKLLNWSPSYSLEDGLKKTLIWYKDSIWHK